MEDLLCEFSHDESFETNLGFYLTRTHTLGPLQYRRGLTPLSSFCSPHSTSPFPSLVTETGRRHGGSCCLLTLDRETPRRTGIRDV